MSESRPADGTGDTRGPTREQYREQLLASIGGWSGMVVAAIPPIVFVVVNAVAGLWPAIIAALAAAVVLAGYRLLRRQPVQQALTGMAGVVIAALIAGATGQARGYFLLGIGSSFAYGAVFAVSVLARRPLVGVVWEFLDPTPGLAAQTPTASDRPDAGDADAAVASGGSGGGRRWWHVAPLRRAYYVATLAATAVFAARAVVQLALFKHNATGWLAVARIAMGYPLTVAALGLAFLVVRRARQRVVGV